MHGETRLKSIAQIVAEGTSLLQDNRHGEAIALLESAVADPALAEGRTQLMSMLIDTYVRLSRHDQARRVAADLEQLVELRDIAPRMRWFLAHLFYVLLLIIPRRLQITQTIARVMIRGGRKLEFDTLRSLHFAYYWYDSRKCQTLGLLQLLVAKDREQVVKALAWFAYSRAYRGSCVASLALLGQVEKIAHDTPLRMEIQPLWAIGLGMNGHYQRSLSEIKDFESLGDKAPEFYRLLMKSVQITSISGDFDFIALSDAIDDCFAYAISLPLGRHQIQTYGAKAMLYAVAHDNKDALQLLEKARRAADANNDNLDWIIYWRWHGEVHSVIGDKAEVSQAMRLGRRAMERYGKLGFYTYCFGNIEARLNEGMNYREASSAYRYVSMQRTPASNDVAVPWPTLVEHALESLLENDGRDAGEQLVGLIQTTFEKSQVVRCDSYQSVVDHFKQKVRITSFATIDEQAEDLRVACSDGHYILALQLSQDAFDSQEERVIGVLMQDVTAENIDNCLTAIRFLSAVATRKSSFLALLERYNQSSQLAAIGRTTQMIAHDIRQPFAVLRSGLGMLAKAKDPRRTQTLAAVLIEEVERSLARANAMLADVMEVGSPARIEREASSLNKLVETCVKANSDRIAAKKLQLDIDLRHTRLANVDPRKIDRVFSNIIDNAIDATDQAGHIWIRTHDHDGAIRVSIGNSGTPIPAADLENIFGAFFTSRKKQGTGLGLAIVKKIIQDHGTTIDVTSSAEAGTEFSFALDAFESGPVVMKFDTPALGATAD